MEIKKNLFTALVKAQLELKNPPKNKRGYGYDYSTLDSILEQVKPVLAKYELTILQLLSGDGTKVGVTTVLAHSSGESIQDTLFLPSVEMKNTNAIQAIGAAITYGRRYGLTSILGISADDDTDASDEPEKKEDKKDSKSKVWSTPKDSSSGSLNVPIVANKDAKATTDNKLELTTIATPIVPLTQEDLSKSKTPSFGWVPPKSPANEVKESPKFAPPQRPTFAKPNFRATLNKLNNK